ncbi:Low temperature requirement protein LtrA [Microbacterium azadirachtae]|uniref:Low temperature requirement protein LtrA n=1 Tax=Microbacterium azadirachtae TaxID=582680 RepID=A0A1I6IS66_9MICO|nr:low temperature requirement protein A [Microbacterium azadirachtae]SFR69584.1 Low temperature requirement protein LtrA [Microbacterium azadirachtae]
MIQTAQPPESERDPTRADWMELFFDLVFVALVGQLSSGLHHEPTFAQLGVFLALFASVWWSWVNLTFAINIQAHLSRRVLAAFMLVAMAAMGAIAVAAPEALGERAWLFALGNASMRALLLALWARSNWAGGGLARVRIVAYNGVTGLLWLVSAFTPEPVRSVLWALAIALEILLLVLTAPSLLRRLGTLNVEHLADRFGTLVIIALGETVLAIIVALSAHLTPLSAAAAVCSLVVAAGLAWASFLFGVSSMRDGLELLSSRGDSRGIVTTFAFLPYALVSGIMLLSGAVSVAIADPDAVLPPAVATAFGVGVALFYATNATIALRYGTPWRRVLPWAAPAVLLPLAVGAAALTLPAFLAIGIMALTLVAIVTMSEVRRRLSGTHP